jgi:hypothetical protein
MYQDEAEGLARVGQIVIGLEAAMEILIQNQSVDVYSRSAKATPSSAFIIHMTDCNEEGFLREVEEANDTVLLVKSVQNRQALR